MAPDPPGDSLACSADLQPSALPVTHDSPLEDQAPAHTHHSAVSHAQPGPAEQGRSEAPSPAETPRPQGEREGALAHAEGSEGNTAGATTTATPPHSPAQAGRGASASPSTPTRSSSSSSVPSSSSAGDQSPSRQHHQHPESDNPADSAPHSSSPTGAADSSPSSSSTSSNRSPSSSPASGHSHAPPSRRVKVYRLKEDAWIDLGTGTCAGVFLQASSSAGEEGDEGGEGEGAARREVREEDEGAWIVVRREGGRKREGSPTKGKGSAAGAEGENAPMLGEGGEGKEGGGEGEEEDDADDSIILRTRVQPYPPGYSDDLLDSDEEVNSLDENGNATIDAGGYQRQQDTLIVWTERGGGVAGHGEEEEMEMALSFATSSGCSEMWEFIKAARRFAAEQQALNSPSPSPSLSSDDRAFPAFSTNSTFSSLSTLPEPSLGNLATLEAAIRAVSRTTVGRERAANIIVRSGFVDKLVKVHEEAEDLESLEDLHALCRVMQTIFLLNDSNLFDLVIKDDLILGVVGMLEYDPDFPTMRASYRAHLSSPSSFVSVVPPHLLPPALLTKIHHTHRLHYLKDVVLARVLEDSTFSMLNSHIYFNEVDIVNEITGARELVREVFKILEEGEEDLAASSSGGGGGGRGRERAANPAAAKGKERELGPKRTLGPELPDDLLAARKKARVDSPPSRTSISFVSSSSSSISSVAQPPSPSSSSAAVPPTQPSAPHTSSTHPSPPPPHLRKLHATLFLAQLAQMAKNLQLPMRTAFYKTLCDRGLLGAIEGALRGSERIAREAEKERVGEGEDRREGEGQRKKEDADAMRGAALGLWMAVVDLDAPDVRAYCLRQGREVEAALEAAAETEEGEKGGEGEGEGEKREKTMLGVLIEMFKREEDLGVRTQLAEALRVLVDVAGEGGPLEAPPRMRQEDPEAERFLQYFYDHCMLSLVQPLMDLPERKDTDPPLDLPPSTTALLSHICDLLCFFISHHTFRSKYLVLSNPLLAKSIARLLRPRPRLTRHTHLRLAALRFIRAIVARTDDFYNRFLIKHDLIRPVLETADEEKEKDNLLGSACLEFFEYLRTTNAKALLNHLMDRSGDQVRLLARGNGLAQPLRTFDSLIARWEMNNEPPPLPVVTISAAGPSDAPADVGGPASASMQRERSNPPGWSPRMELEEESYFDASDEEDDAPGEADSSASESAGPAAAALASASFGSSRRKRGRENTHNPSSSSSSSAAGESTAPGEGGSPKRAKLEGGRTGPLVGLVDYVGEDDSDDEAAPTSAAAKVEPEDPATAGGFIRERRGAVDAAAAEVGEPKKEEAMEVDAPPTSNGSNWPKKEEDAPEPEPAAAAPPPLLSLGELKRKKEEDEDGELGLLAKKKAVSPSTSSSSPPTSGPSGKPALSPAASSTTSKPGGFKFALSGFKAKFGGGKEKEKEK